MLADIMWSVELKENNKKERKGEGSFVQNGVNGVSWLAEETGSDVTHVCFFQLVIIAVHGVDTDVLEGGDDPRNVEAHAAETINEILVVALIPMPC